MELLVQIGNPLSACTQSSTFRFCSACSLKSPFLSLSGVLARDNKLRIYCVRHSACACVCLLNVRASSVGACTIWWPASKAYLLE